jgi:hypothetical protein
LNINRSDYQGNTPFILACREGYLPIVKIFLAYPSTRIDFNHQNLQGMTGLSVACQNKKYDVANHLLNPQLMHLIDENLCNDLSMTPFDLLIENCSDKKQTFIDIIKAGPFIARYFIHRASFSLIEQSLNQLALSKRENDYEFLLDFLLITKFSIEFKDKNFFKYKILLKNFFTLENHNRLKTFFQLFKGYQLNLMRTLNNESIDFVHFLIHCIDFTNHHVDDSLLLKIEKDTPLIYDLLVNQLEISSLTKKTPRTRSSYQETPIKKVRF